MNIQYINPQFQRLERHYKTALDLKDEISFLDLSHTLRVWTEMKTGIDEIAKQKGITLMLRILYEARIEKQPLGEVNSCISH